MTFSDFVADLDTERRTITVLNRTEPDPVYDMLVNVFTRGQDNVDAFEVATDCGTPEDAVVLANDEEPIAVSTLSDVRDALLLVNSDIYVTGTRAIEDVDTPEVIVQLGETRLFAEDYPDPKKQKLLLIEMSRYIEQRAWRIGEGTLYSGFQRLSRMDDESGTRTVYDRLSETDLTIHAYGVPNWEPPAETGIRTHGWDVPDLRNSWFVVFDPPRDESQKVALVAVKPDPRGNHWRAFWTHDPDRTDAIRDYVVENYN